MTALHNITKEQFENALRGNDNGVEGIKFNVSSREYNIAWPNTIVFEYCKISFLETISVNMENTLVVFDRCEVFLIMESWNVSAIIFKECKIWKIAAEKCKFHDLWIQKSSLWALEIEGKSEIQNLIIMDESKITGPQSRFKVGGSKVDNLVIKDKVDIDHFRIDGGSKIRNIDIVFSSSIKLTWIADAIIENSWIAENSTFNDVIFVKVISGKIKFKDCLSVNRISFNSLDRELERAGDLNLSQDDISLINELEFNNSSVSDLEVIFAYVGKIKFENCIKVQRFRTNKVRFGEFEIIDSEFISFNIKNYYKKIKIERSAIYDLTMIDCHIQNIEVKGISSGTILIENSEIDDFKLVRTNLSGATSLSLLESKVKVLDFTNSNFLGSVYMKELQALVGSLSWFDSESEIGMPPDFTNLQLVAFYKDYMSLFYARRKDLIENLLSINGKDTANTATEVQRNPVFKLISSSLGKAEISGCKLDVFSFQYYNSKILDCFITGTELPKPEALVIHNGKSEIAQGRIECHEQRMSYFNQLKKVFENHGDTVSAGRYHSLAMIEQKKVLDKTTATNFKERVKRQLDRITFFLNQKTNNHGEDWLRALVFIVVSGLTLFMAYSYHIWLRKPIAIPAQENYWNELWYHWKSLPEWYLVTHRFDFMSNDIGGFGRLWDFLGRLFIGYGIYQFIAAFRRHGKKAV
jgi:hypothetical protein